MLTVDNSAPGDGATCDLVTAAARLGQTVETVRKRLQRGRLKGEKAADGTWRVYLVALDAEAGQRPDAQINSTEDSRVSAGAQISAQNTQITQNGLVDALTSQVAFLQQQLAARDDEARRLQTIVSQQQTLALQEQKTIQALAERVQPALPAPTTSRWRLPWRRD